MKLEELLNITERVKSGSMSSRDAVLQAIRSGSNVTVNGVNLRECVVCGSIFESKNEGEKGSHYCSDECWMDDTEEMN